VLDNREIVVRFTVEAKDFVPLPNIQTGSGVERALHSIGTRGFFSGGKEAGT
jgi:hypothetical protein